MNDGPRVGFKSLECIQWQRVYDAFLAGTERAMAGLSANDSPQKERIYMVYVLLLPHIKQWLIVTLRFAYRSEAKSLILLVIDVKYQCRIIIIM